MLKIVEPQGDQYEAFVAARASIIDSIGGKIVNKYNSLAPETREEYSAQNIGTDFPEMNKNSNELISLRESLDFACDG